MHISNTQITSKNVRGSNVDFLTIKITSKKGTWKQHEFFDQQHYTDKRRGNNEDFSPTKVTSKRVRGSNVDFSTIKITSKKVRANYVDFSTSEITSRKVRGKDVEFSTIEIIWKKYAEMTWKFVKICSPTYWCNIDVESTWIQRGVPIGQEIFSPSWKYIFKTFSKRIIKLKCFC